MYTGDIEEQGKDQPHKAGIFPFPPQVAKLSCEWGVVSYSASPASFNKGALSVSTLSFITASPGDLVEVEILRPQPCLLNETLGRGPAMCIFPNPSDESDATLSTECK